jgi:excisionase family DNA binding protein
MATRIDDQFLTIAEAADLVRVHRSTIQRMIARGALPSYRIGERGVRIKRSDLESAMLSGARSAGQAEPVDARSLVRPLTEEERRRMKDTIAVLRKLQEEQKQRYGGVYPVDSSILLNEARDERTAQLTGE